jgi:hypothetical protein
MKLSTVLDHIDNGHMALPEFQRGYVWNRDQVRALFASLYRRYPVGSLLIWATQSKDARHRGDQTLSPGVVKLLLDGQQRITSIYGVVRGRSPAFFDGNAEAFTRLRFNLETEQFSFFQPMIMVNDPNWIDVSNAFLSSDMTVALVAAASDRDKIAKYVTRLAQLQGIRDIDVHAEEVTGEDKTVDIVVDIFNRVNSGGTKLSKGDLALAKICADEPKAREDMKKAITRWRSHDFNFSLDWLLRNITTIKRNQARFETIHDLTAEEFIDGLKRAEKVIDWTLNAVSGRLGLDHDRVLFGHYAFPTMARFIDVKGGTIKDARERDRLLYWYLQSAMWGRYSGSTETKIDEDLKALDPLDDALDKLIAILARLRGGNLNVSAGDFDGSTVGARFYPVLYLLTRVKSAKDWGNGLPLSSNMLGKLNRLELHHIFPRNFLRKADSSLQRGEINAVANFCFLTKGSNLAISDKRPEIYFEEIERVYPGALASQWVPMDRALWKVDRYRDFLAARRELLANSINSFLDELLKGPVATATPAVAIDVTTPASGRIAVELDQEIDADDAILGRLQALAKAHELVQPQVDFELSGEDGASLGILDLAWPDGLLGANDEPVALVLEPSVGLEAHTVRQGFRVFKDEEGLAAYIRRTFGETKANAA